MNTTAAPVAAPQPPVIDPNYVIETQGFIITKATPTKQERKRSLADIMSKINTLKSGKKPPT